jgi:hypothetical protein
VPPGPQARRSSPRPSGPRAPIALALLGCLVGCRPGKAAVRLDLRVYLQHMQEWAPVEGETARTLERILATQFVDEAEVRHQIADSRPRIRAHLARIRAYRPRTPPVQRIHARYMHAWRRLLAGYDAIEAGFASGDYTRLARGREAIAAWRDGITEVARALRHLAGELGVEPHAEGTHAAGPACPQLAEPAAKSSGGVLLSHTATVQYHRRWRA